MKQKSLVSVISVTYNLINAGRKEFFLKSVESLHNQTYPDIEHLIIDGASTDGTLNLFKEIKFKHKTTIISEPDTGMWDAMNKGAKKAKGKYILFLNSDDYYVSDTIIEECVNKLEQNHADYCVANFQAILLDGSFVNDFCKNIKPLPKEVFYRHMTYNHETLLCKKSIYEKLDYLDEKYKTAADYWFNCLLVLNGYKQVYVDKPMIAARQGGETTEKDGRPSYSTLTNVKAIWRDLFCLVSEKDVENILMAREFPESFLISCIKKIGTTAPNNFDMSIFYNDICSFLSGLYLYPKNNSPEILSSKWMKKLLKKAEKNNMNRMPRFVYKMFSLYCKIKGKNKK